MSRVLQWAFNKRGMILMQLSLSKGLEAVGDAVLYGAVARAPVGSRDPFGETKESLHTDKTHSREWPKPAVFVATANGYGFFVHEGTVDTPAHPFLSDALDAVARDIPKLLLSDLGSRGSRTKAFNELNRAFSQYQTHRR